MTEEQKVQIRNTNIQLLQSQKINLSASLPIIELQTPRDLEEIKGRMAVMNALVNISFDAPTFMIEEWVEAFNLSPFLSEWEYEVLQTENEDLEELDYNSLRWYLEGIWAFLWAVDLISTLDESNWCGNNMISLLPNLEKAENNSKIKKIKSLRATEEIYQMLDYYTLLHYYCTYESQQGRDPKVNEGLVYERRKALEWLMNKELDWDEVNLNFEF